MIAVIDQRLEQSIVTLSQRIDQASHQAELKLMQVCVLA